MAIRYPIDYRSLSEEDHLILKVLRLYYEHDLTQAEIAGRMGFSRPKVSKLLSLGKERGLIKIEIAEPDGDFAPLEIELENRYGLEEVVITATSEDRESTELSAGRGGAAPPARPRGPQTGPGRSRGG